MAYAADLYFVNNRLGVIPSAGSSPAPSTKIGGMALMNLDMFWVQVGQLQAVALRLHAVLEQHARRLGLQDKPIPDGVTGSQEQVRTVCDMIRGRLNAHEDASLPSNLNPDWDWGIADELMKVLPREWGNAAKPLASVEDAKVASAWGAVKRAMESLFATWEQVKGIREQG